MKNILFICCLLLCFIAAAQQKLRYSYDASGNRVSREIYIPANKGRLINTSPVEEVYTDLLGDIEVKIAPNPTKGKLTVRIGRLPENTSVSLSIYNQNGTFIVGSTEHTDSIELDISDSSAGTYFLNINIGDYNTSWKIIKY